MCRVIMIYVHLKGRNKSSLRWDDHCKWGRKLHCFDRHASSCCLPSRYFCCWCVSPVWEDNSMQAHACSYNTQHFITDGIVSAPATPSNKLLITDHTDTHQLWDGENLIRQRFFHPPLFWHWFAIPVPLCFHRPVTYYDVISPKGLH